MGIHDALGCGLIAFMQGMLRDAAAGGASFTGTTLDPTHTSSALVLSNGDLTVHASNAFQKACYAKTPKVGNATQALYFEATADVLSADWYHNYVWLMDTAAVAAAGGEEYTQGAGYGYYDAISADLIVGAVIKGCLKNGKMYWGRVGTGWHNSGDPAAETGYISMIDSRLVAPGAGFLIVGTPSGAQFTFNFGATAWADTPPAGATGWPLTA